MTTTQNNQTIGQSVTATVAPLRAQRWTLSPEFMVRVAGLPVEAIDDLHCPQSLRWAEDVLQAEDGLRTLAERLGEELARVIGELKDQSSRRDLLRLRRDVHNLRRPADASAATALVARFAPAAGPGLASWLTARERLEEQRARGTGELDLELANSRRALRRMVAGARMRSGLLLASPALEAQLDEYVESVPSLNAKRARKIERSAVSYVYRTAGKPSPFSTFTGVALGRFADEVVAQATLGGTEHQDVPDSWTSGVRISVVALSRLYDAVLADPARRADLPLVPASGWGRDDDRVRYVRRSLRTGDAEATVTLDAARDQLFFLRRSDILEEMLALVSRAAAPTYHEVAVWLADRMAAAQADCEQYLRALLDLGLLQVPLLATGVHTSDPLREFRTALVHLGRPWSHDLADVLDGPIRCLDAYPDADPAIRRVLLGELRRGLGAAMESLGAAASSLPSTLVYEDARAGLESLVCDGAQWRRLVEDPLRSLERILPAFDQTLRHRQTLHGFFLARFGRGGRCEDLLSLVHDFHEDIYDEYQSYTSRNARTDDEGRLVGDPNWLANPTIAALDQARVLIAERLASLVAAQPDAPEVELGSQHIDEVAATIGGAGGGFTAMTHFLQRADDVVVHNSAFGGLAYPFSRFTHWFESGLTDRLRERVRAFAPADAVLAEVTGGFATSNLNLHSRITDYEIVCPGEVSSAPEQARIPLSDLVLEHDVATDRLVLRSSRLGREVVPVYLGYLVPHALPAISRTLLLLSPSATLWLDPWAGVPAAPSYDGVERRPRLRLGSLVLRRRSWTVEAAGLLAGIGAGAGAGEFLAWQRWRRDHDIPVRVFATVRPPRGGPPTGRRPKPQLVDFGSPLSLTSFRAVLTEPDARVELTEMLPDPRQLHVHSPAGSHVAELAVETVSDRTPAALPTAAIRTQRRA